MSYERKRVPVEWNNEWFESQYDLAKTLRVSTGRVNANLKRGWRLKGHVVLKARFDY